MTKSSYADRDTIGTIALEAQRSREQAQIGELSQSLINSLVEDLEKTIASNPFEGRPFYIVIHEKKDALLKNALLRRMIVMEKRPYPETNTTVFWTDPSSGSTRFCWHLPHWSNFPNILANPDYYDKEMLEDVKAYNDENIAHFGFFKVDKQVYANPDFKDRKLKKRI